MEFISIFDRFLLLGDTKNIAFIRMEAHEPILIVTWLTCTHLDYVSSY